MRNFLAAFTRRFWGAAALAAACCFTANAAYADDDGEVSRLLRAGQFSEANAKVEQLLARNPSDPQSRFFKGVIQSEQGKTQDAIVTFNKLTQDYPELPEPYNNLAVLYAEQSQFEPARAALETAIRLNPNYATAHENLGDVYAQLASLAYSKALQLDAGNPGVPPKLTLVKGIFSPNGKTVRAAMSKAAAPTAAPAALPALAVPTAAPAVAEPQAAAEGSAPKPKAPPLVPTRKP